MAKTRRLMASLSNVLRPAGGNKGKELFGDICDARRLLPQQPVTCPRDSAIRAVSVLQGFNRGAGRPTVASLPPSGCLPRGTLQTVLTVDYAEEEHCAHSRRSGEWQSEQVAFRTRLPRSS
jgi:hypothetical protein